MQESEVQDYDCRAEMLGACVPDVLLAYIVRPRDFRLLDLIEAYPPTQLLLLGRSSGGENARHDLSSLGAREYLACGCFIV